MVPFSRRERAFTMFAYRYHFSDGETVSIEIPDDWGEILIDLDRQEYNNDHKETRRHYSLEGKVYEGMDYAVEAVSYTHLDVYKRQRTRFDVLLNAST